MRNSKNFSLNDPLFGVRLSCEHFVYPATGRFEPVVLSMSGLSGSDRRRPECAKL